MENILKNTNFSEITEIQKNFPLKVDCVIGKD
jgi:hypothetical protein